MSNWAGLHSRQNQSRREYYLKIERPGGFGVRTETFLNKDAADKWISTHPNDKIVDRGWHTATLDY